MDEFASAYRAATEALSRLHLNDRREQEAAAGQLAQAIGTMSQEKPSGEMLERSLGELNRRIFDLIQSSAAGDRLGAILAMDRLVERPDFEEAGGQLARYANYLRVVLPSKDAGLMREAARCLGKIIAHSGPGMHEMVEFELGRVFQWLQDKSETNQFAACFVVESLLLNASTITSAYLSTIFDSLWALLRDTKSAAVQEAASRATKAALSVIKARYDPASLGLLAQRTLAILCEELKGPSALSALLVLGHLISVAAEALNLEHSADLFEQLLGLVSHKSAAVRQQLFELVPALAAQIPRRFADRFLDRWVAVLVDALKKDKDRTPSLMAMASTANALGAEITPHLGTLTQSLRALLGSAGKARGEEHWLYAVIASLAEAAKGDFLPGARVLVPLILQQEGLSDSAVVAVVASMRGAPDLVPFVEERILGVASAELATGVTARMHLGIKLATSTPFPRPFLSTGLARTLVDLVENRRGAVAPETRLLAAKALVSHARRCHKPGVFCESPAAINRVVERLLASCALEDNQAFVQGVVGLLNQECFDRHWAEPLALQQLFALFHAAGAPVKLAIVQVCTRVAGRLRALLRPHVRAILLDLATVLRPGSAALADEEAAEAAVVLERLVQVDDVLVRPYVRPALDLLVAQLSAVGSGGEEAKVRLAVAAMGTLTHLAAVAPHDLAGILTGLLDLLANTVQDQSAEKLRLAALRCLGTVLRNVDRDQVPTSRLAALIQTVIVLLKIESVREVRNEALRLLGIIGAIDPYRMRTRELELAALDDNRPPGSDGGAFGPVADAVTDEQYPVVATMALLKILRDPSMGAYHHPAIQALVYIFRCVRVKGAAFLPQALPVLLAAARADPNDFYFHSLAYIVTAVSLHIRPFVPELLALLQQAWAPDGLAQSALLAFAEALVLGLKGECRAGLVATLVLPCIHLLDNDLATPSVQHGAMRVLAAFGPALADHVPIMTQSLLHLHLQQQAGAGGETHLNILKLFCRLIPELDWAEQVPLLVRIIASSIEASHGEARVRVATLEMTGLLLRHSEQSLRPFLGFLGRLADDHQIPGFLQSTASAQSASGTESAGHAQSMALDLPVGSDAGPGGDLLNTPRRRLAINEGNLRRAWEGHVGCVGKDDWWEWWRRFGLELIRESPSQSIRACSLIAAAHYPIVRDLFNVAFQSCWAELAAPVQDELLGALEDALASQEVPAEVIQAFLNLAESMEHEEHPLPIDITTLGAYAIRCHAYAKALYYKELEFQANPSPALVEALISLNSQLQLPDAASGILAHAQKTHGVKLKESWYEKLQQWDDALAAYEARWKDAPEDTEALLGLFRCRLALGDWGGLTALAGDVWSGLSPDLQATVAPWAASSAWGLGSWDLMARFVGRIPDDSIDGSFFRAILAARDESYERVSRLVQLTRERLDADLTAMINESYSRAYRTTVRVQMLAELEEAVEYRMTPRQERRDAIRSTWSKRLLDCQETVDVWQRMLKTRALVVRPEDEQDLWIRFAGLCRRMHRPLLSRHVLLTLLGVADDEGEQLVDLAASGPAPVVYAFLEHVWDVGDRDRALTYMRNYARHLSHQLDLTLKQDPSGPGVEERTRLLARCYVRLGKWQKLTLATARSGGGPDSPDASLSEMAAVLDAFLTATSYDKNSRKAWHGWALTNFDLAAIYERQRPETSGRARSNPWIVPAIQGFFRSIALAGQDDPDGALQDSLRLLTLWFRYGSQPDVNAAVGDGFYTVPVDNWLQVIPQLIARIHVPSPQVRRLVHHVLTDIGRQHPQALLYPLTVASKAQSISRRTSALAILDKMKAHAARLVEQAVMVSQELIRVAITWEELWYEALEEASRLYFGEHNVAAMLQTLDGLHALVERARESQREIAFYQAYGATLRSARELCQRYKKSANEDDLKDAWDLYYQVFRRINKQLPQLTVLDLESASPRLLNARNLDIPIPGTYRAGAPIIKIASVAPVMSVIASKQRPRKLVFIGSDGKKYKFLLKGHEDLRQDERVMQLFGLVNSLLATDRETAKRHLAIQRYSVVPLSQNTGLIGWVPHCDTVHTLIRDYRESRGILLSAEHRLMLQFAPDYDHLTELQKVEVFQHAMANTDGLDLNRVMWKKSLNAESWLERRTTYTRSLAVMSIVGYILGLGDRHPSNLMIDQVNGRVVHIDFGDCFEAAQQRDKFPERVPFRLTRMLVKAMEVSQVEGTFRIVSEHTMRVLRDNKDSVMAVLEAFVYDPLINWRILSKPSEPQPRALPRLQGSNYSDVLSDESNVFPENFSTTRRAKLGTEISRLEEESINRPDAMNAGALNVVTRVSNKLTGREYGTAEPLDIKAQVEHLIQDATKVENLCQSYVGWCPFW